MFTPGFDEWRNDRIDVPEALVRALDIHARGWQAQRSVILEELADAMSIDMTLLGQVGYQILDATIRPLGLWLEERRPPSDRHQRVAREALEDLDLEDVIAGLVQFGWGNAQLRETTPVHAVEGILRDLLQSRLAERVNDAITGWSRRRR